MVQIGTYKIEVPGSKMYSEEECQNNKRLYVKDSIMLKWDEIEKINQGKKIIKKKVKNHERITFNLRGCEPAVIVRPIYDEAYNYWCSNEAPSFSNNKAWKKLNKQERILAHLTRCAEAERGVLVDWSVTLD